MMYFANYYKPMVLYHQTHRKFLSRIRREGLKPHTPGKVWGAASPKMTWGKKVVWLTADRATWRHSKHPQKDMRNPDTVLLTILIDWSAPKLKHYLSWRFPTKRCGLVDGKNNPAAWFVHFGRIPPAMIVGGLERRKAAPTKLQQNLRVVYRLPMEANA
jgi:hypothetical protein